MNVNLSDHEMVYVTRKHVKNIKHPSSFIGRSYVNYNEDLFVQALLNSDWEMFYNSANPNDAWSTMKTIILAHNLLILCVPSRHFVLSL